MSVRIVNGIENGSFTTVTTYTNISQKDKLEHTMKNLCLCLGVDVIYKKTSSRNAVFYKPKCSGMFYQSASNTILELSERLADSR